MSFSREHLLITHTSDSVKLAVEVLFEGYDGDRTTLHAQVERNMSGGLVIKKGVTKRLFIGMVAYDSDASGTTEYDSVTYTNATPALILACLGKTDLKVKSFDDTAFWDGWLSSDNAPQTIYGPMGTHRAVQWEIVER